MENYTIEKFSCYTCHECKHALILVRPYENNNKQRWESIFIHKLNGTDTDREEFISIFCKFMRRYVENADTLSECSGKAI